MAFKEFLSSLKRNIQARGTKDIRDPKKWATYIEGSTIEKQGVHLPYSEIMAYAEQLVYRTRLCQACCDAGVCPHCGCTMPKAAMVASKSCPKERWGKMLDAEDWQVLKEKRDIQFMITQSED